MCVFISTSSRLDSRLPARPTAHSQPGIVYLGVGWSLSMSALEPLHAFIYSSRLDSRMSARPFNLGASQLGIRDPGYLDTGVGV